MESTQAQILSSESQRVEKYYRFHSKIYDATRWSFLFGRESILNFIPDLPSQPQIMEVGCGTGKNIERMEYYFPDANILGVDLSEDMLGVAEQKMAGSTNISFLNERYGSNSTDKAPCDVILLSYSLTMIGDELEGVLQQVCEDLKPRGYIAVVDFNSTPFNWFQQWMGMNHVRMDGHLLPLLKKYFRPNKVEVNQAYLGLWSYFLFLGQHS